MFDASSLDLQAYLSRIGWEGTADTTVETLRALALKHPMAIPFENLDPFFRVPVSLDIAALQRKMVRDERGGYCFEHNILLGAALTAIGFDVTGLAARVMWNVPAGTVTPRSHMLLLVRAGGGPYLVDAGFGGLTLTAPLRLEPSVEQPTPHERFRLVPHGDGFVMEAHVRDEWKPLYRFDLQPQTLADYEVTSWYLCHHPRSHFISTLISARVEPDRRYALRNTEFAIHHRSGATERRHVETPAELRDVLLSVFRTRVPHGVSSFEEAFVRFGTAPTGS